MKLSKEELKEKISKYDIDDDILIEILEDIEDSFVENDNSTEEIEEIKTKYEELKKKYKERFTNTKKDDLKEKTTGLEEKKEIDIKEI